MDDLAKWATGAVITVLIGGTAYTISGTDIVKNFAADTGMTQEQAEQYVNTIPEDELAPFDELGIDTVDVGQELLIGAADIDCVNYEYEWESGTLTCPEGKAQLSKIARGMISLGQAYIKLSSDSASRNDISETIGLIDQANSDLQLPIINEVLDWSTIDEAKKTNSYNKAILQTALESD